MFSKSELKSALLGCLEICLFMPQGIKRYSGERAAALRSFMIPILTMPLVILVMAMMHQDMPALSSWVVMHTVKSVFVVGLFFGIVYAVSKHLKREEHFMRYVNISNWSNLPMILLTLPILYTVFNGSSVEPLESYAVFITLVGYVYLGFILTHCFRVPWEIGGFIAVLAIAVDDNMWSLTDYLHGLVAAV